MEIWRVFFGARTELEVYDIVSKHVTSFVFLPFQQSHHLFEISFRDPVEDSLQIFRDGWAGAPPPHSPSSVDPHLKPFLHWELRYGGSFSDLERRLKSMISYPKISHHLFFYHFNSHIICLKYHFMIQLKILSKFSGTSGLALPPHS